VSAVIIDKNTLCYVSGQLCRIGCGSSPSYDRKRGNMLETIVIILVVLWILGLVSSYTMGGLIHLLLVIALVMILLRVMQGRSPL
jgi:Family of unknown function (DUF5670)